MKKEDIMVSVLLITYNQDRYIRQAIESILEQKVSFAIEIFIGDDASIDGTGDVVREFSTNPQIHIISRQKNVGATRNVYDLQKRAKGKYLAYLEGDDYWCDPEKLQRQVDFLETHPSYIGCTHRCEIVDEEGIPYQNQSVHWISQKSEYSIQDFQGIILAGHTSSLVHRNLFLDSDDRYKKLITLHPLIGDRSLCLLLASQGDLYQLSQIMSCYRCPHKQSRDSVTTAIYHSNPNRLRDDYEYTQKLETYAIQELKINAGFLTHKKELFASAVWEAVKKGDFHFVMHMLKDGHAWSYLLSFPLYAGKKMIEKIKSDRGNLK